MAYDLNKITCSEEWFELSGWSAESKDYEKLLELAKVRERLRIESLDKMTRSELDDYENGNDPFSNSGRYEEAYDYAEPIISKIEGLGYVDNVSIDLYHGNSLVMTTHLNRVVNWRTYRKDIPEVWKGVPIFVSQPSAPKEYKE